MVKSEEYTHSISVGFSEAPISMKNGERDSTYTAYIKPIEENRKSLTVLKYSTVDKVLINDDGIAYGVAYKRHGIPQIAHATKDVIISAGSYSSPAILIKSGIGAADVLNKAEVIAYDYRKNPTAIVLNISDSISETCCWCR